MIVWVLEIIILLLSFFLYKRIKDKFNNKVYIANIFLVSVLIALSIMGLREIGIRLTPIQASRAYEFVEDNAELLKEIKVGRSYLHIYFNPQENLYRTTITEKLGIFYKCNSSTWFYAREEDKVRTLGGTTLQIEDNNVATLYIESTDQRVSEIAVINSEGDYIARQPVGIEEPCILQYTYPSDYITSDYEILALNDKLDVIYYYHGLIDDQTLNDEYKWHAAKYDKLDSNFNAKIKSGNLVTNYNIDTVLNDIDIMELNTLNIPVVINISDLSASDMSIDNYSKEQAIKLIKKLRGKNINIILEPYPWIDNGSKYETEWLPKDMDAFFQNWTTKILKPLMDDIAVPYYVEALNIGSSFTMMEDKEEQFCDMVDYVRRYYDGLVTYRTSWWKTVKWDDPAVDKVRKELDNAYERKLNNKLFGKLDFISIAAYFELTENDTNTVDNLVNAIHSTQIYDRKQNVKEEIENFYSRWNKPIFFGELGFPPTDKASFAPWNPRPTDIINFEEQANCFEAYRRVFEKEQWHLGFSIFAIGSKEADNNYYPNDSSIEVIKRWYVD